MEKIAVITDTGGNMTMEEAKALGIVCFPLQIMMGEETYQDIVEISTDEVYKKIKAGILGKTSMPVYERMYTAFKELKAEGYTDILACPLTAGLSATSQVMETIGRELNINVHIVNMYSTCQLEKYIAIQAKQLVNRGKSVSEILSILNDCIQQSESVILVKDLNHLKNGGRLTPMAASLASLLKIFPILNIGPMTGGRIDTLHKVRTEKKAVKWTLDYVYNKVNIHNTQFMLISTEDPEFIRLFRQDLLNHGVPEENIHIDVISSVIAIHTGMKCFCLQFMKKINI